MYMCMYVCVGTKAQLIAEGLTKRTLATRGEVLVANLKASLATYTRDAMAKVQSIAKLCNQYM